MRDLVDLEKKRAMPGGLTMTEAYIERVNQVGNVARQAAIAEQALTVVYEQALEARDGISGVSLDEEASALVRFQQAYQANAKVMQTAMALFDTILQIR
jgi:flagellar hook-associated protein FlgK